MEIFNLILTICIIVLLFERRLCFRKGRLAGIIEFKEKLRLENLNKKVVLQVEDSPVVFSNYEDLVAHILSINKTMTRH